MITVESDIYLEMKDEKLNIKLSESDEWDWAKETKLNPLESEYYIIDNRSHILHLDERHENDWVLMRIIDKYPNGDVKYKVIESNVDPESNWGLSVRCTESSVSGEWLKNLLGMDSNLPKSEKEPYWIPHDGDTSNLPKSEKYVNCEELNKPKNISEGDELDWIKDIEAKGLNKKNRYVVDVRNLKPAPMRFSHDPTLTRQDILRKLEDFGYNVEDVDTDRAGFFYIEPSDEAGDWDAYVYWVDWDEDNIKDPTYGGKYQMIDVDELMFFIDNDLISESELDWIKNTEVDTIKVGAIFKDTEDERLVITNIDPKSSSMTIKSLDFTGEGEDHTLKKNWEIEEWLDLIHSGDIRWVGSQEMNESDDFNWMKDVEPIKHPPGSKIKDIEGLPYLSWNEYDAEVHGNDYDFGTDSEMVSRIKGWSHIVV